MALDEGEGDGEEEDCLNISSVPSTSSSPSPSPSPSLHSSPVIQGFIPSHRLRDRFLKFTEFLFANLEELNKPQVPWLPPPPLNFSHCSGKNKKAIKGRLPHRIDAISASLSSRFSDHIVVNMSDDDTIARSDSKMIPFQMHSDGERLNDMASGKGNTGLNGEAHLDMSSKMETIKSHDEIHHDMALKLENINCNGSGSIDVIEMNTDVPSKMDVRRSDTQRNDGLHREVLCNQLDMKHEDRILCNSDLCRNISYNKKESFDISGIDDVFCLSIDDEVFHVEPADMHDANSDDMNSKTDNIICTGSDHVVNADIHTKILHNQVEKDNITHDYGDSHNDSHNVAHVDIHREVLCNNVDKQNIISDIDDSWDNSQHLTHTGINREMLCNLVEEAMIHDSGNACSGSPPSATPVDIHREILYKQCNKENEANMLCSGDVCSEILHFVAPVDMHKEVSWKQSDLQDKEDVIHNSDAGESLYPTVSLDIHRETLSKQDDMQDEEEMNRNINLCNGSHLVIPVDIQRQRSCNLTDMEDNFNMIHNDSVCRHEMPLRAKEDSANNDVSCSLPFDDTLILCNNVDDSKGVPGGEISCIQIGHEVSAGAFEGDEKIESSCSPHCDDILIQCNSMGNVKQSNGNNRASCSLHCEDIVIPCNNEDNSMECNKKKNMSCSFSCGDIVIPLEKEGREVSCFQTEHEVPLVVYRCDEKNKVSSPSSCDGFLLPCSTVDDSNEGKSGNTVHSTTVEDNDDLEEGELSEKWIDNDSVQEENNKNEVETRRKDAPELSKENFQLPTDDEMDMPIGFFLSRYYNTRSGKRRDGQLFNQKCQQAEISCRKKKKEKPNKKRKADHNNGQGSDVKKRATGSEGIGLQKGKKMPSTKVDADVITTKEGSNTIKPRSSSKENESAREGEASKKSVKGLLSKAIEEEVGLWTTDAGDDQIFSIEEEARKKPKKKMTAERRQKKQRAKHRKNAQKQEKKQAALGIRKLSFKPPPRPLRAIKKEREIKFCQFYIKGKCNKGVDCSFSHNVVPESKSKMCKYFKNNCCLKGEDCLFSHALSTFPCKFFHTRGHCLDMESCRFSHEPITEDERQELLKTLEKDRLRHEKLAADDCKVASSIDANSGMDTPSFYPDFPSKYIPEEKNDCFADIYDVEATKDDGYFPEINYSVGNDKGIGYGDSDSSAMALINDRKEKAMEILQASLEANQHISKRKFTTTGEESMLYNLSSQAPPVTQDSFGIPLLRAPKARTMETLQSSLRNNEVMLGLKSSPISHSSTEDRKNDESRECIGSKASVLDVSMSSSLLLDKFLKPKEMKTNNFTSVDSILTRILKG